MHRRRVTAAARAIRAECRRTSIDAVAARVSVDRVTVWRWSDGTRRPTLDIAYRIEVALGIPMKHWVLKT